MKGTDVVVGSLGDISGFVGRFQELAEVGAVGADRVRAEAAVEFEVTGVAVDRGAEIHLSMVARAADFDDPPRRYGVGPLDSTSARLNVEVLLENASIRSSKLSCPSRSSTESGNPETGRVSVTGTTECRIWSS